MGVMLNSWDVVDSKQFNIESHHLRHTRLSRHPRVATSKQVCGLDNIRSVTVVLERPTWGSASVLV